MRRPILSLTLLLVALLAMMAAKSALIELAPVREHGRAGEFSAERAQTGLAFILGKQERPHPADTQANDLVRAKIAYLLQGMGLKPIVRDQLACNEFYKYPGVACARVRNVIAVIGPPTGKAVLLNAHYDSTPVGPGAADDGIGVATLIEVASILKDKRLKRPVIFLFNEGEELGLVGARAFLADPLSRTVGSLVNLEARGVTGPVNMFETSEPNAAAISVFARSVDRPVANSLSTDVYRLMPNYTDVNSFAERGWMTLNLAPIGNETRYHSAGDNVSALDHRTLQHMGDQTLALALALANGDAPRAGGKRIFMDVAGRWLITLPLIVGIVLLAGLIIAFAVLAWRRGGAARSAAVVLGTRIGSAAIAWIALEAIGTLRPGMFWRAHAIWTILATYASVILAAVGLIATVGRRLERRQLRTLYWLLYLVIGGIIGLLAPGGIVYFLFPPLLVLAGVGAARWWRPAETAGAIAAIAFAYVTWGEMLALLQELLNGGPMWLFAPLGGLLILPALIEAKEWVVGAGARRAAVIAGLLMVTGWGAAAAAPAYSADRQQRFVIEHVTDVDSHKAVWAIVNDRAPPPKPLTAMNWHSGKLPFSDRPRWIADAPAIAGPPPPRVELLANQRTPRGRIITVRLRPNEAEVVKLIVPEKADIRYAGVDGFLRPIDRSADDEKYFLECHGRSCDGLVLKIVTGSVQPIEFTILGSRTGLPAEARPLIAARPATARPQYLPDETITLSRLWL
jgi:hypothetical protein